MAKAYDIIYKYTYIRKLGYFEIADLEDTFETRYKSEIVKAYDKEQAKQIFNNEHQTYTDIVSVRELNTPKFCGKGREM